MKNVYYNELFDCYNMLLTDSEKDYFKDYYFEDLSYGEIAINKGVSRSAVQKNIKNTIDKLTDYEDKLQMLKLKNKLKKINNDEVNKILEEL